MCEAILIVSPETGMQCYAPAKHQFNGHAVCWVHFIACTSGPRAAGGRVRNNGGTESAGPVEFVQRKADSA